MPSALTLSTMKSIASAILESTGPLAKFPRTIFFSMKAGINQKLQGHGHENKRNRERYTLRWWTPVLFNSKNSLPVCGPGLIEDSGITEWVAQHQRVHSWRLVCVLCKLLRQESTQRGSEQMDLKFQDTNNYYLIKSSVLWSLTGRGPTEETFCRWSGINDYWVFALIRV